MSRIRDFHQEVEKQSQAFHPEDPSTFAVSTLLYPSKFCWFSGDGEIPAKHYENKLIMMRELNYKITDFNNETHAKQLELYTRMLGDDPELNMPAHKSLAPAFHTFGLRKRTLKKKGKKIGVIDHRWSWWRETEAAARRVKNEGGVIPSEDKMKALHLSDKHRGKMAKSVDNYFSFIFKPDLFE